MGELKLVTTMNPAALFVIFGTVHLGLLLWIACSLEIISRRKKDEHGNR